MLQLFNKAKKRSGISVLIFILLCGTNVLAYPAKAGHVFFENSAGFSGVVTDAHTQKPIQGVYVYFTDMKLGTATDIDGKFEMKNLPEGNHLIEISHIGYTSVIENIYITGNTVKNYTLIQSVVENNTVIVTGVIGATQSRKAPFQISVVKREELMQSPATNIIEAITKKAGVSSLSSGPAISKPVIRGLGYNRVLTINDGVRQEGQQWGDEHGIEIDEASVSKIEVLKGPGSLIYGSDAMAGVINIITNVPVDNNTIKANVFSNYQSNNKARTLNANVAGNVNGFNWNVYGSAVAAADYKNKYDGHVFNSKFAQKNMGGYAGYNGNWGFSHLLFSNFNLKAGLIEGERDSEGFFVKTISGGTQVKATDADFKMTTPQIPYQHIRHFKLASDNSIKFRKDRLTFNVGFQHNQREEFGNVEDPGERALYFDLKTLTYAFQLHFHDIRGWKTSVGVNGMYQQNTNRGVEQLIPDYHLFDLGSYIYAARTIQKLSLSGGIRFDNRDLTANNLMDGTTVKSNGFKKSFKNFSGSAGVAYAPDKAINIKLNIARGFRSPSIPELASNGSHEGTTRYEYGDRQLKSETSTQLDAGIDFNTDHISVNLCAYYNSFDHFIFYRKLQAMNGADSTVQVNGSELTCFEFQQQKTVLSGIEATVDLHPHPLDWLHIQNTFSFVSGRLKEAVEGNKFLPFMPAPHWLTELRCDFKKAGKQLHNVYFKFESDNTFAQKNIFTAYNTETETPGYVLLNMGMGADFLSRKEVPLFNIHFSVNNITDVAYQNHLSRLKYTDENQATGRKGIFNMGRNFSVKLNIPLSFSVGKSAEH